MRPNQLLLLCAFASVAACASANTPASAAPADVAQTVRVGTTAGNVMVNTVSTSAANVTTVQIPVNVAWAVLPWVYDSLGIKTSVVDNTSHTLGNRTLKLRRYLGNVALSKYINCGNTQGPPSADTYEIQASILTTVQPDGNGGTTVTTMLESSGRPVMIAGEFANCTSKGLLEQRIVELIKTRA